MHVDPLTRTASAEPGALWSDVIAAAAPYGLAPLSGTPSVGVTGYTLGGGAGWLTRLYGYAADSLLAAELVTADGELLTADADSHPDLFWALRGGSGNFGVATRLDFRLYPVERVAAGMTMHAFDRAGDTLAVYREWAMKQPDTLNTAVILIRMPGGPPMLALRVVSVEDAGRTLAPLLEAAGEPISGGLAEMTFARAPRPPADGAEHAVRAVRRADRRRDRRAARLAGRRHRGAALGRRHARARRADRTS
ncbi:FAD-binding oxidoreductase [Nonomuraea sp. NBC_01738]|uniref:FAD-binding oxidoreductase n=1 Tax=Nonomuraea sp. NBC_01738 TaxID=2976003 RepID=UPI002E0D4575|nr:FAD-binding oxidoreductase [Nonomuraea sp. NBC_01738]